MRIALDAMGGDCAPKNAIEGAVLALKEYPYIEKLLLVGDAVATGHDVKRLGFKEARTATRTTRRCVGQSILAKRDWLTRWFPRDTPGQPWWPASSNSGR